MENANENANSAPAPDTISFAKCDRNARIVFSSRISDRFFLIHFLSGFADNESKRAVPIPFPDRTSGLHSLGETCPDDSSRHARILAPHPARLPCPQPPRLRLGPQRPGRARRNPVDRPRGRMAPAAPGGAPPHSQSCWSSATTVWTTAPAPRSGCAAWWTARSQSPDSPPARSRSSTFPEWSAGSCALAKTAPSSSSRWSSSCTAACSGTIPRAATGR